VITWLTHLIRGWSWQVWSISSLAVLVGGMALFQPSHEKVVDTRGWELDQFLEHLSSRGINHHVRVMPGAAPISQVILSEDPTLSWESIQRKVVAVESIHLWHGTVSIWLTHPDIEMQDQVAMWGRNGCQIGDFVLFGDERILLQIQEAFGR
jgi:hypothetical protein